MSMKFFEAGLIAPKHYIFRIHISTRYFLGVDIHWGPMGLSFGGEAGGKERWWDFGNVGA